VQHTEVGRRANGDYPGAAQVARIGQEQPERLTGCDPLGRGYDLARAGAPGDSGGNARPGIRRAERRVSAGGYRYPGLQQACARVQPCQFGRREVREIGIATLGDEAGCVTTAIWSRASSSA